MMPFHTLMLILSLGSSLFHQLWTTVLSLVLQSHGHEMKGGPAGSLTGSDSPESRYLHSPCRRICRFPNTFQNSWISATLQAVLHLKAVQQQFGPKHWGLLAQVSSMTTLAEELALLWKNDPLDLVRPLLSWFQQCGLQTAMSIKEVRTCERCDKTTSRTFDLGNIFVLPGPVTKDGLSSLLRRSAVFKRECAKCAHVTKTKHFWMFPDILTIHVPRRDTRAHVSVGEEMEVQVGRHKKLTYTLSSVLAHRGHGTYTGHMWAYLLSQGVTVKADNCHVALIEGRPQELHSSIVVYFYERQSG
ncbi:uncharacterized protein LOC144026005 [Festucalex cinctus]